MLYNVEWTFEKIKYIWDLETTMKKIEEFNKKNELKIIIKGFWINIENYWNNLYIIYEHNNIKYYNNYEFFILPIKTIYNKTETNEK